MLWAKSLSDREFGKNVVQSSDTRHTCKII